MITEDLIVYIQSQLRKNVSKDVIATRLASVGWRFSDIQEALDKVMPPIIKKIEVIKPAEQVVKAEPLSSVPTISYKKVEPFKPVFSESFSEAHNAKSSSIETQPKEISAPIINTPIIEKVEVKKEELIPVLTPKYAVPQPPVIDMPQVVNTPRVVQIAVEERPVFSALPTKVEAPVINKNTEKPTPKLSYEGHVPNGAMIDSYRNAILSVTSENEGSKTSKKVFHFNYKWLIPIFILLIIGGLVFAIKQEYIKLPDINLSFIKKDPKTLLLLAPIELGELSSYKTETNISLSFPPLWGVASGLLAGEAVVGEEQESVTLRATGIVSNQNSDSPDFDYDAVINSSLLKKKLEINLKHKDSKSILTTPDLSEVAGSNAPAASTVVVPKGEFDSLLALLPVDLEEALGQLDMDKIFAIGVPSYINKETASIFREFINSSSVIEKPEEEVRGVMTYHYQFNFDQETSRKFMTDFVDVFFADGIDEENKDLIRDRLSALSLDSLEVWIGKDDSKIHQYSFSVRTPLSRLINLEDKGIAGSIVKLDWKTTYYDFDIPNEVEDSPGAIDINIFLNRIKDMETKDELMKFQAIASEFKNYAGNFGTKTNPAGSCTSPIAGSLFSPVGHSAKLSTPLGGIASKMNSLLSSYPSLSCYSTPTEWSLSATLPSDPTLYFCIDSVGKEKVTNSPIIKSSCE